MYCLTKIFFQDQNISFKANLQCFFSCNSHYWTTLHDCVFILHSSLNAMLKAFFFAVKDNLDILKPYGCSEDRPFPCCRLYKETESDNEPPKIKLSANIRVTFQHP